MNTDSYLKLLKSVNILFFFSLQLACADPEISSCPLAYSQTSLSSLSSSLPPSITETTLLCQQCNDLCASCDGPGTSDCLTCSYAFLTNTSSAHTACLESCDDISSNDCTSCHEQCAGCTGPTARDCVTCREDTVMTDRLNQPLCVPQCSGNMYLALENEEYKCQPCHSQCIGCKGSTDSDCSTCRSANFTANSTSKCVAVCPTGYYNNSGSCQLCHEYCVECFGPSAKNCTACVDNEVEIDDGKTECVPSCTFGREYDTSEEKCVLSRSVILYLY